MMRHLLLQFTSSALLASLFLPTLFVCGSAAATPVYLKLDSRFPSGHHPRNWLSNRTRQVQFQRWMRVKTSQSVYGWVPEDHLITPLKLTTEAVFKEDAPGRSEMNMDSLDGQIVKKGTKSIVLEVVGSWARVQPLPVAAHRTTWIPTESLQTEPSTGSGPIQSSRAWISKDTPIFILPGLHARIATEVRGGRYLTVLREAGDWLEIIPPSGGSGYIRKDAAITLGDLKEDSAFPILDNIPLRSAPLPYADLIRDLTRDTKLTIVGTETLRWGQARVPEAGLVWWPITDTPEEDQRGKGLLDIGEKIATEELFKKKIFDMAASPSIRTLKFVSAEGVYRTIDGLEWTKLPDFKNKNYPIAIAGGGSVFVGPFLSDDHGETFEQWIRWDSLLASLKRSSRATPNGLQILEIKPKDASGRHVALVLNVGLSAPIQMITRDQGRTWEKSLNRPEEVRKLRPSSP